MLRASVQDDWNHPVVACPYYWMDADPSRAPRSRVPEIRVDTIGDLAPGCAIYAFCGPCQNSAKLNLVKLRMKYGPGLLLDDLKRCVTCSKCGRRTSEIRLVNAAK